MTTQAVTPSASAAEREPSSVFLPRDRNYRMTGELPAEKEPEVAGTQVPEEEPETNNAETAEASAASESETAAASETAQEEQQPERKPTKTAQTSESRWAKLSRENRELRDRLARLEGRAEATPERETKQEPQPAAKAEANPRPKIDDVDPKTGVPKYSSYEQYEAAKDEWLQKEAIRQFTEQSEKRQREAAQEQAEKTINEAFAKRVQEIESKYSDFKEVALSDDLKIAKGGIVDTYSLMRLKAGGLDVLYYLGQNPSVLEEINAMPPGLAWSRLVDIEFQLTGKSAPDPAAAPKKVTSAPRPPRQVSGQGAVIKDAIMQAIQEGDSLGYRREMNERDPKLLAVRRQRGK